jgi:hypothetical protein
MPRTHHWHTTGHICPKCGGVVHGKNSCFRFQLACFNCEQDIYMRYHRVDKWHLLYTYRMEDGTTGSWTMRNHV